MTWVGVVRKRQSAQSGGAEHETFQRGAAQSHGRPTRLVWSPDASRGREGAHVVDRLARHPESAVDRTHEGRGIGGPHVRLPDLRVMEHGLGDSRCPGGTERHQALLQDGGIGFPGVELHETGLVRRGRVVLANGNDRASTQVEVAAPVLREVQESGGVLLPTSLRAIVRTLYVR